MSLFHRNPSPILNDSEYTVVLAAEVDNPASPGRLTRLLYTGHDGSHGVLRAVVPGGDLLWQSRFASDHDIREGLIALAGNIVVTHDPAGQALVGHEMWTGKEALRAPIGQLVDRLGIDRSNHEIVAVTFDHVVHGLNIATGADRTRGTVMTDEARKATLNATDVPCSSNWYCGSSRTAPQQNWSYLYEPCDDIGFVRRDWAGTTTWGMVRSKEKGGEPFRELGQGSLEGCQQVGSVSVIQFNIQVPSEGDRGATGPHFFLFGAGGVYLGVLREKGASEFFEQDAPFWSGRL